MATVSKWNPFGVALDLTATAGTVTRTSADEFTVVINASWECYYSGGATNFGMKVTSGGKTIYIPEFDGDEYKSSGSGTLTGTYDISGNSGQTKSISVVFDNYKDSPVKSATKTITLSVDVPAWTSYTIKYDANGGSGAPGNQTKWKNQSLTLSSTKPTRAGHSFLGWSTSSTATNATYAAGANYTANAGATLYAVWKADTYQVTFNANGGTGAPAAQTKTYGKTLTLSSTKPTRTNYNFKGWGTSASSTTATYAAGGSYTANAAATLYAVWELAYSKPRITNFTAVRCDYQGNIVDDGTYLSIRFDWACDRPVKSIIVNIYDAAGNPVPDQYGDTEGFNFTPEYGDVTSGTESLYVYDLENIGFGPNDPGPCDTDKTYTVRVTVTDEIDSYNKSVTVNGLIFPIDFLAGGKGVAFGKPAEKENTLDSALKILASGGFEYPVLPAGTDFNDLRTPNHYSGQNANSVTYVNCPITSGSFTLDVIASGPNGQTIQRLTKCEKYAPQVFERTYYTNTWGDWYGGWLYPAIESEFEAYSSTGDNLPACRKDGRVVEIRGIVKPINDIAYGTDMHKIITVPDGYRPSTTIYALCQGSGNCVWLLRVNTNGAVELSRYRNGSTNTTATAGTWLPFQITY